MDSLGRQPAGGSERWPRPGIAGLRPLAGDGASRRPKAVSNPRNPAPQITISRGAATDVLARGQRLTPQPKICRPSGAFPFFSSLAWGSRPRLNIFRASGALFSNQRPTRESPGDSEGKPQAVTQEMFERSRSSGRYFARSGGGGQTTCRSSPVAGWGRLSAVAWSNGRCTRSARFEW